MMLKKEKKKGNLIAMGSDIYLKSLDSIFYLMADQNVMSLTVTTVGSPFRK